MAPSTQTPFALILAEMVVAITAVILFCLEYPVDFRSRLWENGGELGYNSNPNKRIYYYANHLEPQSLAASNLAIAMLGLVVFVARTIMSRLRCLPHHINIIYDMILFSLWAIGLAGQTSSDFSDPKHPSPHPWYLTRGCSVSWDRTRGYCHTAQAGFAISIMAGILYGTRLIREIILVAYARGQRHQTKGLVLNTDDVESAESLYSDGEWESSEQKASRNSLVLSPVLAFFPSDSESRW
ncbi:hypothetical protein FCULG_00006630 [Fusarium culmorum]|uniref:MARVEL domain-containing protein n=1 Tax=Fusarium culmorum TaxID=5516 RepID=A0A2T4GSR8_FUSCU|nr:hypothetical protein FCULG_00006630 [Fusarium culmorum]